MPVTNITSAEIKELAAQINDLPVPCADVELDHGVIVSINADHVLTVTHNINTWSAEIGHNWSEPYRVHAIITALDAVLW